jgi:hypothetical protein
MAPTGGFTLPRLGNGNSKDAVQEEVDAVAGKLVAYKSITKRWRKAVKRHFRG